MLLKIIKHKDYTERRLVFHEGADLYGNFLNLVSKFDAIPKTHNEFPWHLPSRF